jgi:hypothetical protein
MALYANTKGAWGSSEHRLTRADADTFRLEFYERSNTGRSQNGYRRQYMTRDEALTWGKVKGYDAETIDRLGVESCGF